MPRATVASQAATPAGSRASGRRQARDTSHPAARPHRNGQEVDAIPASDSPLTWLARPMTTKITTQQMSSTAATRAGRIRCSLPGGRSLGDYEEMGTWVIRIAADADGSDAGPRLAVKDCIDVAGLPTSAGCPVVAEMADRAETDAAVVAAARRGGGGAG